MTKYNNKSFQCALYNVVRSILYFMIVFIHFWKKKKTNYIMNNKWIINAINETNAYVVSQCCMKKITYAACFLENIFQLFNTSLLEF